MEKKRRKEQRPVIFRITVHFIIHTIVVLTLVISCMDNQAKLIVRVISQNFIALFVVYSS